MRQTVQSRRKVRWVSSVVTAVWCVIRGLGCEVPWVSLCCLLLQYCRSCPRASLICPWSLSSVDVCLSVCLQQHLAQHLHVCPYVPLPTYPPKSLLPCVSPGTFSSQVSQTAPPWCPFCASQLPTLLRYMQAQGPAPSPPHTPPHPFGLQFGLKWDVCSGVRATGITESQNVSHWKGPRKII